MEVVNARAALLSNYEVLTLLRELESDHLAKAKAAIRVKKDEDTSGNAPKSAGNDSLLNETSENLRTVEVEAIQYLSADYLPTNSQSPEGIKQLVQSLSSYELTKAEKLQIVNLAPTLPVELYVIVEELEDRLGEQMGDILSHVQSAFTLTSPTEGTNGRTVTEPHLNMEFENNNEQWDAFAYPDADGEEIFDDTGEGAGVEGDLDMEED